MPAILLLMQNWGKMALLPAIMGSLLVYISIILLFLLMTLHDHRLYQILRLEATFRRIRTYPKSNNQAWFILIEMNKNSEQTIIFPEIRVKALCLMLQSLKQSTLLLVHIVLACWLLTETVLVDIIYYVFLSSKHLTLFSKLGRYNTKSSPFQLLSSSNFFCTWLSCMW